MADRRQASMNVADGFVTSVEVEASRQVDVDDWRWQHCSIERNRTNKMKVSVDE
jgi:hypothetical protein